MIIKILENPNYKKGSARAKWFTASNRSDGKDVEAFYAAATKKPPGSEEEWRAGGPAGVAPLLRS